MRCVTAWKHCGHDCGRPATWTLNASTRPGRIARLRDVTTPDESISAQAGLANEPVLGDDLSSDGSRGVDDAAGVTDIESAPAPDAAGKRLADLPDEPGEAHVAAYAAAADELAERLDESGTGHDDNNP